MNRCEFSVCRTYRYVLTHRWEELMVQKTVAWIGLNPSTANEQQLDPTLRRVRWFSAANGFNSFHMLNLFAFRATDPRKMKKQSDPVGKDNDYWIKTICDMSEMIIACWGMHGRYHNRDSDVRKLLIGKDIYCLSMTDNGMPAHPLYLPSHCVPILWRNQLLDGSGMTSTGTSLPGS